MFCLRVEGIRVPVGVHSVTGWRETMPQQCVVISRPFGPVSKRGNRYLRVLLIHGARSALLAAHRTREPDSLQFWAIRTARARGHSVANVALANRMARIAWRVWRDQRLFQRRFTAQEDAA